MNSVGVRSCGQTLLQGPSNTFDYVLHLTDGKQQATMFCHRSVLSVHSKRFNTTINGENYFDQEVQVLPGYMGAMLELIQFMYLKDTRYLTQHKKIKKLCIFLDVPLDLFRINFEHEVSVQSNQVVFQFEKDPENRCVVAKDLLRHIKLYQAKLSSPEKSLSNESDMQYQTLLEKEESLMELQNKLELWEEDIKTRERDFFQSEQKLQEKMQDYEQRLKILKCREKQMEKQMESIDKSRQDFLSMPQKQVSQPNNHQKQGIYEPLSDSSQTAIVQQKVVEIPPQATHIHVNKNKRKATSSKSSNHRQDSHRQDSQVSIQKRPRRKGVSYT